MPIKKKTSPTQKRTANSKTKPLPSGIQFPDFVHHALTDLRDASFDAYLVGGSLRDAILGIQPKDWDITTNALPEEIQNVFLHSWYNNKFGTVGVHIDGQELEITTYRTDIGYTDYRHPDKVKFGVTLQEDLERRDFTINAMASDGKVLIDLFGGADDIEKKLIRAVGKAEDRFKEDALRMMRAVRLAAELDFLVETGTLQAIQKHAKLLPEVSMERIRDELMKTVASNNSLRGLWLMFETGLLPYVIPELMRGVQMAQNKHHIYSVFFHNLMAMQATPSDDPLVRLAALLHDVGKPHTKKGEYPTATFYNHEIVGADHTKKIMRRLKFSKEETDRVSHLVKHHMFYYSIGEITDAGVRRLIKRIGKENIQDIMALRIGDRIGSGVQKDMPYKLIELLKRIEEVQQDPIDTRMLEIDGHDVMKLLKIKPGPVIGKILNALLEEILDDPKKNTREYLLKRAAEISQTADQK